MAAAGSDDDDDIYGLQQHLEALYPFSGAPSMEPFAALCELFERCDPAGSVPPPPLLPMIVRQCQRDNVVESVRLPVHAAALDDRIDLLEACLAEAPHLLDEFDDAKNTHAVHMAARGGALRALRFFADKLHLVDRSGRTTFFFASMTSNVEALKYIEETLRESSLSKIANCDNTTPLHVAARFGSIDVLQYIMEPHKLTVGNKWDETPLHYCAESGDLAKLRMLLEHVPIDAVKRMRSTSGATIAHAACRSPSIEVVDFCVELLGGWNAVPETPQHNGTLLKSAGRGKNPAVFAHVRKHVAGRPLPRDDDGWTPLHSAAARGHWQMFSYLRRDGYDVNAVDNDDYTVLAAATNSGNLPFFKHVASLMDNDLCRKPHRHGSIATLAVSGRHIHLLEYAISKGWCSMSDTTMYGASLVLHACRSSSAEVLRYVAMHGGGTLQDVDRYGRGVDFYVRQGYNPKIVEQAQLQPPEEEEDSESDDSDE